MKGSVKRRGTTWTITYDEARDPATGQRRQRSRGGFRTKAEAQLALAKATTTKADGTYVVPHRQTVGDFLVADWLPTRESQLRPSTFETYKRTIRAHVLPRIGQVPLADLDPGALNRLYSELLANGRRPTNEGRPAEVAAAAVRLKAEGMTWQQVAEHLAESNPEHGPYTRHSVAAFARRSSEPRPGRSTSQLSPSTVTSVHTILKRALKDATRWGRIARNPADLVDPPGRGSRPPLPVWDADTLRTFLGMSDAEGDTLHTLWLFLASTGVRRGEALGLTWSNLDLGAGFATIIQTLVTVGHTPTLSEPKTAAGRRPVKLDDHLIAALRTHRTAQLETRMLMGAGFTDNGLVFCQPDGSVLHPDRTSRTFQRRTARYGLPVIPLHGLRHTWATLAMSAGVHPKVVQERLGHSHISITLGTYSHVVPSMHDDAAELVAGLFRPQS